MFPFGIQRDIWVFPELYISLILKNLGGTDYYCPTCKAKFDFELSDSEKSQPKVKWVFYNYCTFCHLLAILHLNLFCTCKFFMNTVLGVTIEVLQLIWTCSCTTPETLVLFFFIICILMIKEAFSQMEQEQWAASATKQSHSSLQWCGRHIFS